MHAIQTSGNCIRNLTADPHAGATADEVDDPRIWAEAIRQWSTFHPEFSFLPRKFKIAVTAVAGRPGGDPRSTTSACACSATTPASSGFEVLVGGGLGRTPYLGPMIREHLPARHLLSLSAGDPARLQPPRPARQHLEGADQGPGRQPRRRGIRPPGRGRVGEAPTRPPVDLPDTELARIRAAFTPRDFETPAGGVERVRGGQGPDPAFARFARNNVQPHKIPGYAIVDISLKKPGETPGDCSAEQMDARWPTSPSAIRWTRSRVTYEQNLILPHVKLDDVAGASGRRWRGRPRHAPTCGLITDIIACPGLDYCALANARAIPIAQADRPPVRRSRTWPRRSAS